MSDEPEFIEAEIVQSTEDGKRNRPTRKVAAKPKFAASISPVSAVKAAITRKEKSIDMLTRRVENTRQRISELKKDIAQCRKALAILERQGDSE